MFEKLQITRDNGRLQAMTWDRYGGMIDVQLSETDEGQLNAIMDKAKDARPQWERDLEGAQIVARNALQDKQQAVEAKQKAEVAQGKAEQQAEAAEAARTQAVADRDVAVRDKARAEAEAAEWRAKLAEALTGGLVDEVKEDTIMLYAELAEGISVDAGDWYRIGLHLIRAKQDMVVSADNWPTSEHGADYWEGVPFEDEPVEPAAKYPAGTVIEWSGVNYRALVDTDQDPGEAPDKWELATKE